ncbi:MAG: hypothetical protein ACTSPV_06070 [Candidatus Hodarchaeales archaeon]
MEIEELDCNEEIKELDGKIVELEKKLEQISGSTLLMKDIIQRQNKLLENLERLEEKRSSISGDIYISLKQEYLEGIEKISEQIANIQFYLTRLLKEKKADIKSLKLSLEKLVLRKEIEEMPEEIYRKEHDQLKKDLEDAELLSRAIEYLLSVVEIS